MLSLKALLIRILLWIYDLYYKYHDMIIDRKTEITIERCRFKNNNKFNTRVLYACSNDGNTNLEITEFMKYYCLYNELQSYDSAYSWVAKCTKTNPLLLELIFVRYESIMHSKINLDNGQEIFSNKYLDDMILELMPGKCIADFK